MFSTRVNKLNPYVPGEQPKDREYIKLNANENPYPPSPKVISEISNFVNSNGIKLALYPDPDSTELLTEIAEHLNKTGGCMNNPQKLKKTITKDIMASEAIKIMNEKKITNIFVIENKKPIGVIHIHDLLNNGVA